MSTGKERYKSRLGGNFSASPVANARHVYFFSEEGEAVVFEAGDELREVARNRLEGRIMASPAIVGQAIFPGTPIRIFIASSKAVRRRRGPIGDSSFSEHFGLIGSCHPRGLDGALAINTSCGPSAAIKTIS